MLSPAGTNLEVTLVEDGDVVIIAWVSVVNDPVIKRVRLFFKGGAWLKSEPIIGEDSPYGVNRFERTELDVIWDKEGKCLDTGVYLVEESDWLDGAGANRFGCIHFAVEGRSQWVELLAKGFSWSWQ